MAGRDLEVHAVAWQLVCRIFLDLLQLSNDLRDTAQVLLLYFTFAVCQDPEDDCLGWLQDKLEPGGSRTWHFCSELECGYVHQSTKFEQRSTSSNFYNVHSTNSYLGDPFNLDCITVHSERTAERSLNLSTKNIPICITTSVHTELDYEDINLNSCKLFFLMCFLLALLCCAPSTPPANHKQLLNMMAETKTKPYTNFPKIPGALLSPKGNNPRQLLQFTRPKLQTASLPNFSIATMEILSHSLQKMLLMMIYQFLALTHTNGVPLMEHSSRIRSKRAAKAINVPLRGCPNEGYCANIAIGSTEYAQELCVLIDTGSANLAVAAAAHPDIKKHFNTTNVDGDFKKTKTHLSVAYTGGEWSGTLASDQIAIVGSEGTSVPAEAHFALIQSSKNFYIPGAEWQGIMGLAYPALAKPDSSVEPYWDTLRRAAGLRDVFALQLCPPLDSNTTASLFKQGGQLTLGGPGSGDLHTGTVFNTAIVQEEFYTVEITNISIGGVQVNISCSEFNSDKTIVDSGTTDVYLPTKAFNAVLGAFHKYFKGYPQFKIPDSFWNGDSKLAWSSSNLQFVFDNFPTVYVGFASKDNKSEEFALAVTSQIYLRKVEGTAEDHRGTTCQPNCDFFVFGIKERDKGTIIGSNVLLGFGAVFDREVGQIGFAKSTCQYQYHSKKSIPHIVGPYSRDAVDCKCHNCYGLTRLVVGIATPTILLLIVCIILAFVIRCCCTKTRAAPELQDTRKKWSCCKCRGRKQISQEENSSDTEDVNVRHTSSAVTDSASNGDSDSIVRGCFGEALERFKVLMNQRHLLGRADKMTINAATGSSAQSQLSGTHEVASNDEQSTVVQQDEGIDNATEDFVTGADDTISLLSQEHPHHTRSVGGTNRSDELVVSSGKTFNYIEANYPKLALSESPHDSLASSHTQDFHDIPETVENSDSSAVAYNSQATKAAEESCDSAVSSLKSNHATADPEPLVYVGLRGAVITDSTGHNFKSKKSRNKNKIGSKSRKSKKSTTDSERDINFINNQFTMGEEEEHNLLCSSVDSGVIMLSGCDDD